MQPKQAQRLGDQKEMGRHGVSGIFVMRRGVLATGVGEVSYSAMRLDSLLFPHDTFKR